MNMPENPARKVIIIEEDPNYRTILQHILKGLNLMVVGVESGGDEAIDLFEKKRPDVVLLNITIPLEHGLNVLKELKKIKSDVMVIMITNVTEEETVKRCIQAGADGYLLKGSTDAELRHRLANLINL